MRIKQSGITLLELTVVVVIVAILAAVAYPSFTDGLRQSRRAEAFNGLLTTQLKQEEFRVYNTSYATALSQVGDPVSTYYTFSISGATATGYTLIATTKGAQVGDTEGSISCDTLSINKADIKTPAECWR